MKKITELVGSPKNYGLSPEEQEEEDRRKEEERKRKQAEKAAEMKRRKKAALAEMALQYEQWVSSDWGTKKSKSISKDVNFCDIITQQENLAEVKCQEEELMEACALPLRSYLMKIVIPPLSEALLDCSKIKPADPVDYLVLPR